VGPANSSTYLLGGARFHVLNSVIMSRYHSLCPGQCSPTTRVGRGRRQHAALGSRTPGDGFSTSAVLSALSSLRSRHAQQALSGS